MLALAIAALRRGPFRGDYYSPRSFVNSARRRDSFSIHLKLPSPSKLNLGKAFRFISFGSILT